MNAPLVSVSHKKGVNVFRQRYPEDTPDIFGNRAVEVFNQPVYPALNPSFLMSPFRREKASICHIFPFFPLAQIRERSPYNRAFVKKQTPELLLTSISTFFPSLFMRKKSARFAERNLFFSARQVRRVTTTPEKRPERQEWTAGKAVFGHYLPPHRPHFPPDKLSVLERNDRHHRKDEAQAVQEREAERKGKCGNTVRHAIPPPAHASPIRPQVRTAMLLRHSRTNAVDTLTN